MAYNLIRADFLPNHEKTHKAYTVFRPEPNVFLNFAWLVQATIERAHSMYLLIIADLPELITSFYDYFGLLGHVVDSAYNSSNGLEFAVDKKYDAIVLDADQRGINGLNICQSLRDAGTIAPICLLSNHLSTSDKIKGYQAGADDFLDKPVDLNELNALIEARVRRSRGDICQNRLQVGDLVLLPGSMRVERDGKEILLPPVTMKILEILMRASPGVLTRLELERRIWGDNRPNSNSLKVHIHNLRMSIDKPFSTPYLHTIQRKGYQLLAPAI